MESTGNDNDGDNALFLLCEFYQAENVTEIILMLIEDKIDVNWKNNQGWNALHCVCRFQPKINLKSVVEILVKNKIDKHSRTIGNEIRTSRSFLLERFQENEIKDVIQMLDSNA